MNIPTAQVMKLSSGHRLLKFFTGDNQPKKCVCIQQHRIVEKNVIDANDFFLAKYDIRSLSIALVYCQANSKMGVVIQIRSGGDNPINKAGFNERNQR